MAVLVVNLLLTFTDQVGPLDWATGLLDAVLLAVLLGTRGLYRGWSPR